MESPISARRLRWWNWKLRWKVGAYTLNFLSGWAPRSLRRDVVIRCLQGRQWRLALTVLVMPRGWSISKAQATTGSVVGYDSGK